MMRYLLILLLLPSLALAGELNVTWDESASATGYRVHQSVDLGATWTRIADVPAPPVLLVLPDTGLVLLRVSAYNSQQEAIRWTSGIWYNALWAPPAVINLGVQ